MDADNKIRSYLNPILAFALLFLFLSGCSQSSNETEAEGNTVTKETPTEHPETAMGTLAEHGIQLGMKLPEDGRTLVGVIQLSSLPETGIQFINLDRGESNPDECICVCDLTDCDPPDCPNCPKPLCPGGYVPPCPQGQSPLPDLRGLLAGPRSPDGR